ncbi:hypothetical protein LSA36186_13530 [Lachnoanaerobaculum sp. JCM 36186]|jgi:putative type I restriction-modification system specificity determinant|uniref:restriction endonuclease subunit S n=1 Tax=Lachnoanaerobaculum sanguinis TaxID=3065809 RepID=UPI0020624CE0|nr:restriction endonuclease subunit S [Lachnoanaerobaculum sp. JCM 36186]GMO03104.1 hypothetical protein LSA36186_13530 [Lachnoanaerobaculum sp. JCM 36186]DAO12266.1 MAG TPA: hypothetical protein [Caudoviricetes sp.]
MTKLIEITGKALLGEWGTDDETGEGIPVLRTTNFTNKGVVDYSNVVTRTITKNNIDEKFLRSGDIIIEKSGGSDKYPVGRVVYFDGPSNTYLFNNFTGVLRVRNQEKWFPKYVFYSLYRNYRRGGTRAFENKTTGLHNLKTDDYVSRYEVTGVDYSKQRKICTHLDMLYSIIKMREEVIVKLDELIKARFVELFGDPIKNNKGWDMPFIEDVVANEKNALKAGPFGSALKKEYYVESGYKIYGQEQVISGDHTFGDYYIDEERYKTLKNCAVQAGDVLISLVGTYGKLLIMPEIFEPGIINPRLMKITFDKDKVNPYYFKFFFQSESLKRSLSENTHGGTMDILNLRIVRKIAMPLPPVKLQNEFADFIEQVNKSKLSAASQPQIHIYKTLTLL